MYFHSSKFGNQKHEVYEHLTTINNGIDILTNKGSKARSVFKGKVVAVIALPGGKKAVLIQHGEFFTMYSNLNKVFVDKGDSVETKEDIGTIITDENGKTEVHFEIVCFDLMQQLIIDLLVNCLEIKLLGYSKLKAHFRSFLETQSIFLMA